MNKIKRLAAPILIALVLISSLSYGGWLWYDSNVDRSGWVETDVGRIYQDFHAQPVSGWQTLDNQRYYFYDGGIPARGWVELEGKTCYFGENGVLRTGWQHIEGRTYYFDSAGFMLTGWQEIAGSAYYLDSDGVMAMGWLELKEGTYYLPNGILVTGWQDIDGRRYYFQENGLMHTGELELEDSRYRLDDTGAMVTGWQTDEDGRRYFAPEGPMVTGWMDTGEGKYYFLENGLMYTGWLQAGEYRYYFPEDGKAVTGRQVILGETHYFTPKGIEVILVNAKNPVPEYYQADLVYVHGDHRMDASCAEALKQMLADCVAAGNRYEFNSGYRSVGEQSNILEVRTQEHMTKYDLDYDAARRKALQTVAYPGSSEHHLGLAVDLLGSAAQAWLSEHCWEYGFIVRYLSEKSMYTGISYEPWHFRYVGREVSMELKGTGLCLEEYLGADPVYETWEPDE